MTDHAESTHPLRILFLHPETMGPSEDPERNQLSYLSRHLDGDYLAVWCYGSKKTARQRARQIEAASGTFGFYWPRWYRLPPVLRQIAHIAFYIGAGLCLSRRNGKYDVIVSYGVYRTALAAIILRALTGSKLIVQFPGHPYKTFELYPGVISRLKRRIAPHWARFVAKTADHLYLLYPSQLDGLGVDTTGRVSAFHDFTVVSSVKRSETAGKYVLFLGFPFHLKGVDLLIQAFNRISPQFPDTKLKIVGHCPDRSYFEELCAGNPNIEMHAAVRHEQAIRLVEDCCLFVLPSRTEAMGRVLLEAMAAGKPVVASRVDGIPYYVRDGETGLLFERENVAELAERMTTVLKDPELARRLGNAGYEYVHTQLSEVPYAEHFREMVEVACGYR